MKFFNTIVLLFAGLASVQAQSSSAKAKSTTTTAYNNTTTYSTTISNSTSSTTSSSAGSTATLDLQGLLNSLGGGLNLGSIDFGNRNEVVDIIGLLMNQLCIGNFFNGNILSSLGGNQQLQLLLQLDQLNQLNQLGFLNNVDLQGVFNRGFGSVSGGFRGPRGFIKRGSAQEFGFFKRAVDKVMAKLDVNPERRNANMKRGLLCNIAGVPTATAGNAGLAQQTQTSSETFESTATSSEMGTTSTNSFTGATSTNSAAQETATSDAEK